MDKLPGNVPTTLSGSLASIPRSSQGLRSPMRGEVASNKRLTYYSICAIVHVLPAARLRCWQIASLAWL